MSLTQFLSDLKCIFTEADKTWIKRHRLLNTATVFDTLYGACTRNRGLVHIIAENQSKFSDVAIHNARVKIPLETFKKVNTSIIQTQKRVNSSRILRWMVPRCMSILLLKNMDTRHVQTMSKSQDQQNDL